jgi:hypothetical protein
MDDETHGELPRQARDNHGDKKSSKKKEMSGQTGRPVSQGTGKQGDQSGFFFAHP